MAILCQLFTVDEIKRFSPGADTALRSMLWTPLASGVWDELLASPEVQRLVKARLQSAKREWDRGGLGRTDLKNPCQ
jgi:hypothetical protein